MRMCKSFVDPAHVHVTNVLSVVLTIANVLGAVIIITIVEHYFRKILPIAPSLLVDPGPNRSYRRSLHRGWVSVFCCLLSCGC